MHVAIACDIIISDMTTMSFNVISTLIVNIDNTPESPPTTTSNNATPCNITRSRIINPISTTTFYMKLSDVITVDITHYINMDIILTYTLKLTLKCKTRVNHTNAINMGIASIIARFCLLIIA